MKTMFFAATVLVLSTGPSFAFSTSGIFTPGTDFLQCLPFDSAEYEEQVAREVFHRVGNQGSEKAKGIALEIMWRDRYNCDPENIKKGRYAELSSKANDPVKDVLVRDKATGERKQPQMKDIGSYNGVTNLCNNLESGLDAYGNKVSGKYQMATVVVNTEAFEFYKKALNSSSDNACKRLAKQTPKKELHDSGISSEKTVRVAETRVNGEQRLRVDANGDLKDNYGNSYGKVDKLDDATKAYLAEPLKQMEVTETALKQRDAKVAERATSHAEVRKKSPDFDSAERTKVDYATSKHKVYFTSKFKYAAALVKQNEVNDKALQTTVEAIKDQASSVAKTIRIPEGRIPGGVSTFLERAMPVLKNLPWMRSVTVVATAAGTGFLVFEIVMNDDPEADLSERIEEAMRTLAKEGVVTLASVAGGIAGGAAGGAASSLICGAGAPVCIAVTTTIGAVGGAVVAGFTTDYVIE